MTTVPSPLKGFDRSKVHLETDDANLDDSDEELKEQRGSQLRPQHNEKHRRHISYQMPASFSKLFRQDLVCKAKSPGSKELKLVTFNSQVQL